MSGLVYKLNEHMIADNVLKNIPITDYPLMLTFGDYCDFKITE